MHWKHNHDHGIDKKEKKHNKMSMEKVNFLLQQINARNCLAF